MNRFLAALTVALVAANVAVADGLPPGAKRVTVDYKITTEKDYPDYLFFTVIGKDAVAVKLDSKTPLEVLAKDHKGGRFQARALVAVPKDAAKTYDGDKEFFAAIAAGKVEGQLKSKQFFYPSLEVKDTEKRNTIVVEYKLDKIDAKDGIVLVSKKDEPKKDNGKDSPDEEEAPVAGAPRSGALVAGLAAFAALTLGGLWLTGRARRKL